MVIGKVEDSSEIALLTINDRTVPLEGGKGFIPEKDQYIKEFSYQVSPLKIGENTIDITVWDKAGNIGATTLRIIRQPASSDQVKPPATPTPESATPATEAVSTQPDTLPPVVTIISPEPDSVITEDSVLITGKVKDESKISQIMVNGKPVALADTRGLIVEQQQTQEFTHRVTELKPGINTISIAVWDAFGNIGTATIQITRKD